MRVAALVLAAGGSQRLGQPKQLLPYQEESFIRRIVRAARAAGCSPIVVVVGRDREQIFAELDDFEVTFVPNEKWKAGIGSSIRAGIKAMPAVQAAIILACDQPYVTPTFLRQLIEKQQATRKGMIGSAYAGTVGIPALFLQDYFPDLLSLGDEQGAKTLLLSRPDEFATVKFPEGAIDVDTWADYSGLPNEKAPQPSP